MEKLRAYICGIGVTLSKTMDSKISNKAPSKSLLRELGKIAVSKKRATFKKRGPMPLGSPPFQRLLT